MVSPIDQQWDVGSAVMGMALCNMSRRVLVVTADGVGQQLGFDDSTPVPVNLNKGATLTVSTGFAPGSFIAGGEDGRVVALAADGGVTELATHRGKWIEHLAVAPKLKQVFYAFGKEVHRLREDGSSAGAPWVQASTVGGIAVHPQDKRLAVTQYNYIHVYPLNAKHAEPLRLDWKGSHLSTLWHPAGDIVMTTMQEAALHGWRLTDKEEMRMSGYEAKVESIAFVDNGRYLATGGSRIVICWPFFGGGPWGKTPLSVGGDMGGVVTNLAAHPKDPLLATGYENGALQLIPMYEGGPLPLLPPNGDRLSALSWTVDGMQLYAGTEGGKLYRFTVDSVTEAFS